VFVVKSDLWSLSGVDEDKLYLDEVFSSMRFVGADLNIFKSTQHIQVWSEDVLSPCALCESKRRLTSARFERNLVRRTMSHVSSFGQRIACNQGCYHRRDCSSKQQLAKCFRGLALLAPTSR